VTNADNGNNIFHQMVIFWWPPKSFLRTPAQKSWGLPFIADGANLTIRMQHQELASSGKKNRKNYPIFSSLQAI
jgi:hypothetical protein